MKKLVLALFALIAVTLTAVELEIDGKFSDFSKTWRISSRKVGTVELVPDQGVNYVQLSAEAGKKSSIGILTAGQGIQSKKGDVFTISVDVKGGPLEVSIIEYGGKKYLGATKQIFRTTGKAGTRKVSFTVREPNTDSVRIAFKVKRGATAVISNVKVDMKTASAPEK